MFLHIVYYYIRTIFRCGSFFLKEIYCGELDVICQHSHDGTIIPLRIRLKDDEGEYQTYTIKQYKDMSYKGAFQLPNGFFVNTTTLSFECRIVVFGVTRRIWLLYNPPRNKWSIFV